MKFDKLSLVLAGSLIACIIVFLVLNLPSAVPAEQAGKTITPLPENSQVSEPLATPAVAEDSGPSFDYNFQDSGILEETGLPSLSSSPYFWLDSGAKLIISEGIGSTLQGRLDANDFWRAKYWNYNPTDTDKGYRPQNIFRLVTRKKWLNFSQAVSFKIIKYNSISNSPLRAESNGILLFERYQDAFNLYYAGLRVDGSAIIKKKIDGNYHTLAEKQVFSGKYDRNSNPNLLPLQEWIRLKTESITNQDNSVTVRLFLQDFKNNEWALLVEATDNGIDGNSFLNAGNAGIRTDFMDVQFKNYSIREID